MGEQMQLARNRSEVFYTATVLPMIACAGGIDGVRPLLVAAGASEDAVGADQPLEFVTEYDHAKAIISAPDAWATKVETAATPDVVVLASGDRPTLVAIEAKMFHRPAPGAVAQQMERQREVLEVIAGDLPSDVEIVQAVLVPAAFPALSGPAFEDCAILTWEQLLELYPHADPYWRKVLQGALENYEEMKPKAVKIYDDVRPGSDLVPLNHGYKWMGLAGGEKALRALADDPDGRQTVLSRRFEVRYEKPEGPNANWLPIDTFREIFGYTTSTETNFPEGGIHPVPPLTAAVAMSWRIVLDLFDRGEFPKPAVQVHVPIEGGGYDMITIRDAVGAQRSVSINRVGSIHLEAPGKDHLIPWRDYLTDPEGLLHRICEWLAITDQLQPSPPGDARRRFMLEILGMIDLWRAHHERNSLVTTTDETDVFGYHHTISIEGLHRLQVSEYGGVRLHDGTVRDLWRESGADALTGAAILLGWIGPQIAIPDTTPLNIAYTPAYDIDGTPCLVATLDADTPELWTAFRTDPDGRRHRIDAQPFVVEWPRHMRQRPSWPDDAEIEGP